MTYHDKSDIDLALVFGTLDDASRFDVQVQLLILASLIDTRIDPYPISHNDFHSHKPFSVEITRTGK